MKEINIPNAQETTTSFSATELSLIWSGIKILIAQQKKGIKDSQEPYTQTLKEHLNRLIDLEQKLKELNIATEDMVLNELKKY